MGEHGTVVKFLHFSLELSTLETLFLRRERCRTAAARAFVEGGCQYLTLDGLDQACFVSMLQKEIKYKYLCCFLISEDFSNFQEMTYELSVIRYDQSCSIRKVVTVISSMHCLLYEEQFCSFLIYPQAFSKALLLPEVLGSYFLPF